MLPGGASGKESACQCRRCKRHKFDPWVRKIPWSRKWQPTLVFLPRKFHGLRILVGYRPWGHKGSDTSVQLSTLSQLGFPGGSVVKSLPANAGDAGDTSSIPGTGRFPGGGNGNLLQYFCLGNPMDRGAWWATVHRVAKSQAWLSDEHALCTHTHTHILGTLNVLRAKERE